MNQLSEVSDNNKSDFNKKSIRSSNAAEFSHYNLSVIFNPSTSSVTGNLSVNFYNNDLVNFTQIPFHLFLSGMKYQSRMGDIEILNVQTISEPKTPLTFVVNEPAQLLWVTLETELESNERAFFEIEFTSIIPDGGDDRANSHGSGDNRIYKFTSFYPMPCVYDVYDGWNTDPYLDVGDPFYHDMAYYNLIVEAPNNMKIAATGELVKKINKGATTVHFFDPVFPVREVTFAASEGYQIQSAVVNGVNISTYYIPKSSEVWEDGGGDAIYYAVEAFNLFSNTFGLYPYSTLNIVEEYAEYLGMEYPAQVYVSEVIDTFEQPLYIKKWYLEKVIVHEIAHQWWYNLVGVDEVDWGFLDEGLTCWSTDYYGEIIYSDWHYFQYPRYYNRVRTYFATDYLPSKINQSAYELITDNLDWGYISYYKSPLIFEKICRTIGQSNFLLGLNTFFEQYKYEIALLSDLQEVFEDIVNASLDWFFFPWFDNDYLPNYWITTCDFNDIQYELTVIIEDQNEAVNDYTYSQQVPLYVYDSEDSVIYNDVIWINSTTTLIIPLGIAPERVRLVYGHDVIVQLWDPAITYIDALVGEDVVIIFGYDINLLLIFSVLPLIYVIYNFSIKKKSNSKL